MFEIIRNSPKNCLVGKIIVLTMNVCLWLYLLLIIFEICISGPLSLKNALIASGCLVGLIADFFFLRSYTPDLSNPFKKAEEKEENLDASAKESLTKASRSGGGKPDMSAW